MSVYYEGAEPPDYPSRHLLIRSLALTFAASIPFLFFLLLGAVGLLLYGVALFYLFLLVFAQIYYLPENSKPSIVERLRLHRCPYCMRWSSRMVDRRAVGEETNQSTPTPQVVLSAQAMVGPDSFLPGDGMVVKDARIENVEPEVEEVTFKESFKCSRCGKTWTRDVTHATKMILKPRMKEEAEAKWQDADL
ncbi:MAG: hypothetical protein OK438_00945 [Thaumarchaeota archaeon]|nr:hypothetical protein [Nitrososphaerota archaeon]